MFKDKLIKSVTLDDVAEITLLSIEEWKRVVKIESVPRFTAFWWLRSPGDDSSSTCGVDNTGDIYSFWIIFSFLGIRPAFKISHLNAEIGEKIFVCNTLCTVIDKNYVLSDRVICLHQFDKKTNVYENSEIKRFIDSDEFKEML